MTIQDTEETAEFKVLEKPIIQKPLIAESDVVTIDNNLSTYVTGTQKRELTVGLGYLDSVGYETLRRIRDRQYAVLKYPTVTITADEPVDMGYGEDVPDYRQRLLQLKGKNLFDKDSVTYLVGYPTGTTIVSNTYHRTIYIPCEPNTTYTVQKINQGGNKRFALATTSVLPDVGVAVLQFTQDNNADSLTITTDNTANYLLIWCWVTNDTGVTWGEILNSLQVEKGPTATTYEAYFNIELCKIGAYQDYIYKSGDDWYVHKEIGKQNLDGSQGSISRTGTNRFNLNIGSGYKHQIGEILALSDKYVTVEQCYTNSDFDTIVSSMNYALGLHPGSETNGVRVKDIRYDVATDYQTWLNANPIALYYVLATPTDTEITNDTLKAQLNALQNSAFDRWTDIKTEVQEPSLQPYLTVTQGEITGSGKEVMLEGTTEDLLDFVILGDTAQDGTPTPDSPIPVQTVNGDIAFDFSGPSGVKRYTMVGKMTLADQRIIDNCGTNEQVQVSFRESKQL